MMGRGNGGHIRKRLWRDTVGLACWAVGATHVWSSTAMGRGASYLPDGRACRQGRRLSVVGCRDNGRLRRPSGHGMGLDQLKPTHATSMRLRSCMPRRGQHVGRDGYIPHRGMVTLGGLLPMALGLAGFFGGALIAVLMPRSMPIRRAECAVVALGCWVITLHVIFGVI